MDVQKEKINAEFFTITLKNDFEDGTNELKMFSDIITKLKKEIKKIGYKKMFNREEIEFIEELCEYFTIPDPLPNGVQDFSQPITKKNDYEEM